MGRPGGVRDTRSQYELPGTQGHRPLGQVKFLGGKVWLEVWIVRA